MFGVILIIMKKFFLFIMFLAGLSSVFSQSTCPIKRAFAFYTVNMPGTVRVDDKGNEVRPDPMIERVIYLECSGTAMPVLDSVLYKDRYIKGSLERIREQSVTAGIKANGNMPFRLTARKGYNLWKLQLETMNQTLSPAINCPLITIRTRVKGKPCKCNLYKEDELQGIPRY